MSDESTFEGQSADLEAIYVYMKAQTPKTPEAATIRSQFLDWYSKGGMWDRNFSSDWYDEARSRRNMFNLANAKTVQEKKQVEKVLATGMTTEQMQGKSRPTINIKTGAVGSQVKSPTIPGLKGAPGLTRLLKKGVRGDDVKQWQSFLGLTPPTGYFDDLTDKKTRGYQKNKNLKVDGIVGPKTWTDAFAMKDTPFAEPSKPMAATSIHLPKASTPKVSLPSTAVEKPSSIPKKVAEVKPIAEAAMVPQHAGLLPSLKKIPWWGKALAVLGAGGTILLATQKVKL